MPRKVDILMSQVMFHEITLPSGRRCKVGDLEDAAQFDAFVVDVCKAVTVSEYQAAILITEVTSGVERTSWMKFERWYAINLLYKRPGVAAKWHSLFASEVKS